MSLINFGYLRKKRIVTLIVILTLTSSLFSITAYSFLGFYNGFTGYVGQEPNIVAVYSRNGSTPFTGVVSIDATNQVASLQGVIAVSPEVIAPCMINQQAAFVRGVMPKELTQLNQLTFTSGENITLEDTNAAVVGSALAGRLNLKVGQSILVFSVLSQRYVELQVKGIFTSSSSLNDEVLVPIYVGQWLRNLNYNQATLIRAKIDPTQTNPTQLYQQITNKTTTATSPAPTPKSDAQKQLEALLPLTQNFNYQNIGVEQAQSFMQSYLNRYGINKDTLVILSVVVLFFASATAIAAINLFVKQHASDINIIRAIGVTAKKVKTDLILRMTAWALIATALGTIVSVLFMWLFQRFGYLLVLSHTITFQLDPLIVVANFLLLSLLVFLSIARVELKQ